jgi:hypothetical protein
MVVARRSGVRGGPGARFRLAVSYSMVTHMKTTIDISDALLEAAKAAAARENRTLRDLVEQGLRAVLAARRGPKAAFKLRDASFAGQGVQPGVDLGDWERVVDAVYEGRGG